jgi:hypothetical protein
VIFCIRSLVRYLFCYNQSLQKLNEKRWREAKERQRRQKGDIEGEKVGKRQRDRHRKKEREGKGRRPMIEGR